MAPRGRSKPGTSRMDAAVDAMKPFGFDKKVVTSKMRELVKTYNGHYGFIESDAYLVLLEALLEDKEKEKCEKEIVCGETSETNEIVEGLQVEESNAIVPTVGLVDIPSPPPSPLSFDGFLPSLPHAQETSPPPSTLPQCHLFLMQGLLYHLQHLLCMPFLHHLVLLINTQESESHVMVGSLKKMRSRSLFNYHRHENISPPKQRSRRD